MEELREVVKRSGESGKEVLEEYVELYGEKKATVSTKDTKTSVVQGEIAKEERREERKECKTRKMVIKNNH